MRQCLWRHSAQNPAPEQVDQNFPDLNLVPAWLIHKHMVLWKTGEKKWPTAHPPSKLGFPAVAPRTRHQPWLVPESPGSVKVWASRDSHSDGDGLSWADFKGLLFLSITQAFKSNTEANKTHVIPRRSSLFLKNTGTEGCVPKTGTPDVRVTISGAQAGTAGHTPAANENLSSRLKIHF